MGILKACAFMNKAHTLHSFRPSLHASAWLNWVTYRKARDLLGRIWELVLRASPLNRPGYCKSRFQRKKQYVSLWLRNSCTVLSPEPSPLHRTYTVLPPGTLSSAWNIHCASPRDSVLCMEHTICFPLLLPVVQLTRVF